MNCHVNDPLEIAARIEAPNISHTRPEGELHRAAGAMLREMAAEIDRLRAELAETHKLRSRIAANLRAEWRKPGGLLDGSFI